MAMTTLVTSASQADGATTLSSAVAYNPALTVEASIVNGQAFPNTAGKVQLLLSIDGTNYFVVDTRAAGIAPGQIYWHTFKLADYTGASQFWAGDGLQRLNAAATTQWSNFKVNFYGNQGAAVNVFCQYG